MTDKKSDGQLFFSFDGFDFEPETPEVTDAPTQVTEDKSVTFPSLSAAATPDLPALSLPNKFFLQQAVLAHLVKLQVAGAALHVPCRIQKFHADLAAYWSRTGRRFREIAATALVDVYADRNECLPECADRDGISAELAALNLQREVLEEEIRRKEPELRETDELFGEFQSYDFSRSTNRTYQKLLKRMRNLHQALYKGTRMEQLTRAAVADCLYLAVPEGLIAPEELLDGWGLWYVSNDGTVREVKAASKQECDEVSRRHLVQNIGTAALRSVLFANGVKMTDNGKVRFTKPPRARRK